jgi:hypothetical protein
VSKSFIWSALSFFVDKISVLENSAFYHCVVSYCGDSRTASPAFASHRSISQERVLNDLHVLSATFPCRRAKNQVEGRYAADGNKHCITDSTLRQTVSAYSGMNNAGAENEKGHNFFLIECRTRERQNTRHRQSERQYLMMEVQKVSETLGADSTSARLIARQCITAFGRHEWVNMRFKQA